MPALFSSMPVSLGKSLVPSLEGSSIPGWSGFSWSREALTNYNRQEYIAVDFRPMTSFACVANRDDSVMPDLLSADSLMQFRLAYFSPDV